VSFSLWTSYDLYSPWVPLYSGEGVHLTPPPRLPRVAAAKGEARAAAARARSGRPPKP
jgi:hypothetical protein